MSRTATYGVPYVGNDLKVPHKPKATKKHSGKSNNTNTGHEQIVEQPMDQSHLRLLKYLLLGVFMVLAFEVAWYAAHGKIFHTQPGPTAPQSTTAPSNSQVVVSTENLKSTMQRIETQPIVITTGGTKVTVTSTDVHGWLSVAPTANDMQKIVVNELAVEKYVDQVAAQNTVKTVDQVEVDYPDGTKDILTAGVNGFTPGDTTKLKAQLKNDILSGKGVNAIMPGAVTPFKTTVSTQAKKTIEVNIVTKRMYAYENGVLVRTFLVTAGAPLTPTPTGTFTIWEKFTVQDMRGKNPDGTDYYQPNVQWISYFDHSADAIHGNYWRPASVFGNVNTSHGCVGITNDEAKWVYYWAPIGTQVTIHK